MKKIIILFLSLIFLSACSINININQDKKNTDQTPSPTSIPAKIPTSKPTPKETMEVLIDVENTIESQLTLYFTDKFNKSAEDIILTVSQNTGSHASGGIKFQGEIGGGMWLAYKDNDDNWIVVFDGNGTIPCTSVETHNFPSSIITECWDETNSKIKQL